MELSEQLLQNVITGANLGMWDWYYLTGQHDVSDRWLDILGLDPADVIGKKGDWSERIHPDDRSRVDQAIQHAIDNDVPYRIEFRMKHSDGSWIWIEGSGRVIEWDAKHENPIRLCGTHQDISERKLSEEVKPRFQQVIESSLNEIYMFDNESFYFIDVNPGALNNLGYSMDELRKMTPLDIKPKFTEGYFNNLIKPLRTGIKEKIQFETVHKRKDGTLYDVEVHLHLTSGNRPVFVAIILEITDRKQVEQELSRSRKLESIGLLAGGIAHDFNNILTGLFGNLELAKMKLSAENASFTYIETAYQALGNASNLTKQLLTFAKGGNPLLEATNLGQTILDSISLSLSGSNVKTIRNLPKDLWQVKADKGQLSQVITNIILNADQAMPMGGTLIIEAKNIKDNDNLSTLHLTGECVKLTIRDDGIGISKKHLEQIFDPYFSTKQSGHGLGLAMAHSIISKHGGRISADSVLGEGTIITIYIPADTTPHQSVNEIPLNKIEESTATGHILVMDDNKVILALAVEMLTAIGYTAETAIDGKDALEKYISADKNDNPFDAVIMDLTIPGGVGGKEAVQEIITLDPNAKVIVSSGYSTDPVMADFKKYGFLGRLAKPFEMNDLKKELSRLIQY